mgnify:CR=1 FL=1
MFPVKTYVSRRAELRAKTGGGLILLPGNAILHSLTGQQNVNAALPATSGLILVALSTALTMLGGLIPSRSAAKCNPVIALRAE